MLYVSIFLAFFIPNIIGYGGGPAIIPLIEAQVVGHYHWMTTTEFSEVLALGNALPSPIATKMAGYIGYQVGGVLGAVVALFATIAPSLLIMILALRLLHRFRDSPKVHAMGLWVLPVITVLMAGMTYTLLKEGVNKFPLHFVILFVAAGVALEKFKLHPTWVIAASLGYGAWLM